MAASIGSTLRIAALLVVTTLSTYAAATVGQQVSPAEINVGDQTVVTLTVQNSTVDDLHLPEVDGLQLTGTRTASNIIYSNGTLSRSMSFVFALSPTRSGDFIIPAFDAKTEEGDVIHIKPMKVHVLSSDSSPQAAVPAPATPPPSGATTITATVTPFNPNGPVTIPPTNTVTTVATPTAPPTGTPAAPTTPDVVAPRDPDGGPAKVFMIITPDTTDAYVGQSIPLKIDFYIRMTVNWEQNSLPTIKGSDFLMNNIMTRGRIGVGMLENMQYMRETWVSAISAPKGGDFPLSMERDTYWVKSITNSNQNTLFGSFFGPHRNLAHEMITSNPLTMHVHELPTDGRPDHFTGAIGQFKVTGEAAPLSVNVGEPVTLRFTVSGVGNFDYVRSPTLHDDLAWKAYVPSSKVSYMNESRTNALKTFQQSIIPQKNGDVPLPSASFSYFDPSTKQYVVTDISLPKITVTGMPSPSIAAAPDAGNDSVGVANSPKTADFLPNRLDIGWTRTSLAPAYRHPWFWAVQTGLVALPIIGAILLYVRWRNRPDDSVAERALRRRSQQQEEEAMTEAARKGDAVAFFLAARHAIQLQLGAHWNLKPEAITLGGIRARDPQLAETLQPLFAQADEVIYSGKASSNLDLTQWEQRVRTELLQPQPA